MKNKFIYFAVLAALGFASCEPEFENEVTNASYSAGEADFSTYVAIGNSLTAGYMDGTVSRMSQANSYPSILAKQFAVVGGGEFTQPSYEDDANNVGGLMLGGAPILHPVTGENMFPTRYVFDATEKRPERINATSTVEISAQQHKAYNNMGVPGAKVGHVLAPGYGSLTGLGMGTANPFFVRHAIDDNSSVLGDAMTLNPTFFTNWIGSNDVLLYAVDGADSSVSGQSITPTAAFDGYYDMVINTLTSNGAKGVVATIPDVTSIPYFTTVPYAPLTAAGLGKGLMPTGTPEQQVQAGIAAMNQLNTQLYNNLDAVFTAFGEPNRVNPLNPNTANPVLINDEDAADRTLQITGGLMMQGVPAPVASAIGAAFGKSRQSKSSDLVVLPASSAIGKPNPNASATLVSLGANLTGVSYPMEDRWILIPSERSAIASAISSFNAKIKSAASAKQLAVADMNAIMLKLVGGLRVPDGQIYTANYFNGTNLNTVLFSLDGIHPNARGYAVIANEIIKVINMHYKSRLPLVTAGNYPGATILGSN